MKAGALAMLILLLATGAHAQRRGFVRPAPPPSTPSAPAAPPGVVIPYAPLIPAPVPTPAPPTPFDARPWTYAPRYSDPRPRYNGGGLPYYSGAVGIGEYVPAPAEPARAPERAAPAPPPPPQRAPEPPPVPELPRVAAIHPDTFYVIPGCYAGNRPPNPARLPKGCDLSKLTTTAIR